MNRTTTVGAGLAIATLLLASLPTAADHPQHYANSAGAFSVQFEHDGDNEWWVEVQARGLNGDSIHGMWVRVEGDPVPHAMQAVSNDWERTQQGWKKYASAYSYDQVHVPPGKRVMFEASM